MKKMIMTLMAVLTMSVAANAMSFEQARQEALFLTDKMAYELNLTDAQYEACYEINLDYLMSVTSRNDVYGTWWERRNLDLSYILLDWQWTAYQAATYFLRPLIWEAGLWHFVIYRHYPHRDFYYFGRPHFYATYRGGHSWHRNGGRSYYAGHRQHFRTPSGHRHVGMHDRYQRGDYRNGRPSSTRYTAHPNGNQRRIENRQSREIGRQNREIGRQNRQIERNNRQIERQNREIGRQNHQLERNNRSIERSNRTIERSNRSIERSSSRPSHSSSMGSRGSMSSRSHSSSMSSRSHSSSSHSSTRSGSSSRGGGNHHGGRR